MLVNLQTVLKMAEDGGFCIPAFNVYNMETVIGVLHAAEETKAPIIMQIYPRLMKEETGYFLSPCVLAAAARASVPVCFHLDHGPSELETTRSLRYGATGIMLDGSTLPFEENIALTRRVVETCAHLDVGVEGELGHVGFTKDEEMDEFTTPEDAKRFVEETGVSCLAVAVGTAHGRYKQAPVLQIERIKEIKDEVKIPLVLHGGSGVPDEQIRLAVQAGIRKINFGTDLCYSFLDSVFAVDRKIYAIDLFMKDPIQAVKNFAVSKIQLLGANERV